MDIRMFSLPASNAEEFSLIRNSVTRLEGVQDIMERHAHREIVVIYDNSKLTIAQIVHAAKTAFPTKSPLHTRAG